MSKKKAKKWKESVPEEAVMKVIDTAPIEEILKVAKTVCPVDDAIRHYNNPKEEKYFEKDNLVRRSLKKAVETGAFNSRTIVIDLLQKRKCL